jgi:hypothetical protein
MVLVRQFEALGESKYASESLAREIVRLTVQILAYQQGTSADNIYNQLDQGQIDLPPEFLDFIRRRNFQIEPRPEPAWLDFIHHYFPRRRTAHLPGHNSPAEIEAGRMLAYVEELLSPSEPPSEALVEPGTPDVTNS